MWRNSRFKSCNHVFAASCTPRVRHAPYRVSKKLKNQFVLAIQAHDSHLAMADSDATTSDENPPGLISESEVFTSETEEEEYVLPPPRPRRRKKKYKNAKRSKASSRQKRSKCQSSPKKRKTRRVVARNTTYASKQKCVDRDAIKEFLQTADCGCEKKCIRKLQLLMKEGAVDALYALRQARFASTLFIAQTHLLASRSCSVASMVICRHPGVSRCS